MSSLPRPIRRQSAKQARRAGQLARTKRVVSRRARNRCEGCGVDAPLDLSHVFGRGCLIDARWADTPELLQALCRECHRAVDGHIDPELRDRLRWEAAARFAITFTLPYPVVSGDPVDWIRGAERELTNREGAAK